MHDFTKTNQKYLHSIVPKVSVVIVDDSEICGSHLKDSLIALGFNKKNISVFNDALASKDSIFSLNKPIVFLDIEMPSCNGIDFFKTLKSNGFSGKVVFTTAHSDYILDALRAHAYDYLLKPVSQNELSEALKRLYFDDDVLFDRKERLNSFGLSKRQIEIIEMVFDGKTSSEIANELFLSKHTVDTHRRNILKLTGVKNTHELLSKLKDVKL